MLVISRKAGEAVRIGDDIEVTIVKVGSRHVRLKVSAPRDKLILRSELVSHEEPAEGGECT